MNVLNLLWSERVEKGRDIVKTFFQWPTEGLSDEVLKILISAGHQATEVALGENMLNGPEQVMAAILNTAFNLGYARGADVMEKELKAKWGKEYCTPSE